MRQYAALSVTRWQMSPKCSLAVNSTMKLTWVDPVQSNEVDVISEVKIGETGTLIAKRKKQYYTYFILRNI